MKMEMIIKINIMRSNLININIIIISIAMILMLIKVNSFMIGNDKLNDKEIDID